MRPQVSREEYDALSALLKDDPQFPETYDSWLDQMSHGEPVRIRTAEFSKYCRDCGQAESMTMLNSFAVFKARKD